MLLHSVAPRLPPERPTCVHPVAVERCMLEPRRSGDREGRCILCAGTEPTWA